MQNVPHGIIRWNRLSVLTPLMDGSMLTCMGEGRSHLCTWRPVCCCDWRWSYWNSCSVNQASLAAILCVYNKLIQAWQEGRNRNSPPSALYVIGDIAQDCVIIHLSSCGIHQEKILEQRNSTFQISTCVLIQELVVHVLHLEIIYWMFTGLMTYNSIDFLVV